MSVTAAVLSRVECNAFKQCRLRVARNQPNSHLRRRWSRRTARRSPRTAPPSASGPQKAPASLLTPFHRPSRKVRLSRRRTGPQSNLPRLHCRSHDKEHKMTRAHTHITHGEGGYKAGRTDVEGWPMSYSRLRTIHHHANLWQTDEEGTRSHLSSSAVRYLPHMFVAALLREV